MKTYHPETNEKTKRYNRTMLSALRTFAADHPTDWDQYINVLPYAYDSQLH